jgi:hypothetical protein
LTITALDCQSLQTVRRQAHSHRSAGVQFGWFDGPLENAELMAEREDLELQRRPAPEGSENSGQKSGQ